MVSKRPASRPAPVARIVAAARAARVRLVRFLYTDNGGVTRGKATHVESLAQRMADGIGLTVAMQAMNMLDQLHAGGGDGARRRDPPRARSRRRSPCFPTRPTRRR